MDNACAPGGSKVPLRSPKWPFPRVPVIVSFGPVDTGLSQWGAFVGPSHFYSVLLVLLDLVALRCMDFGRALHCEAGLCVLSVADVRVQAP